MTLILRGWDYTQRAASYDLRADYAEQTVAAVLALNPRRDANAVVDIGAGTGKLTKLLLKQGLAVTAVEPNEAMLARGIANLSPAETGVSWVRATAESTALASSSFDAAFFGSSFNVVRSELALNETFRILRPSGQLAILWNHRDLEDPLQVEIERRIRTLLPSYSHGARREDPSPQVCSRGRFLRCAELSLDHVHEANAAEWVAAWSSHATLAANAGALMPEVVCAIKDAVGGNDRVCVPYRTRIWTYRRVD
jgi:ubiquinone/menaquinone biosynthesis C-methylase UbiE